MASDIDAFVSQVQSCKNMIHKVLYMYADSPEDKQDLRQEILSQAWSAYPRFNATSKFSTWFYKISINVALSRLKKEKKYVQDVQTSPIEYSFSIDKELLDLVISFLNELEKSIVLLMIEGYERNEIASVLGVSENNLRVKIHRLRKKLEEKNIYEFIEQRFEHVG